MFPRRWIRPYDYYQPITLTFPAVNSPLNYDGSTLTFDHEYLNPKLKARELITQSNIARPIIKFIFDGTSTTKQIKLNTSNELEIDTNLKIVNNSIPPSISFNSTGITASLKADENDEISTFNKFRSKQLIIDNATNPQIIFKKGSNPDIPIGINSDNEIYISDTVKIYEANPQMKFENLAGVICSLLLTGGSYGNCLTINPGLTIYNGTNRFRQEINGSTIEFTVNSGISNFHWQNVPHNFDNEIRAPSVKVYDISDPQLILKRGSNPDVGIGLNGLNEIYITDTVKIYDTDPQLKLQNSSSGAESSLFSRTGLYDQTVACSPGLTIASGVKRTKFEYTGNKMIITTNNTSEIEWDDVAHNFLLRPTYNSYPLVKQISSVQDLSTSGCISTTITGARFKNRDGLISFTNPTELFFTATANGNIKIDIPSVYLPSVIVCGVYTVRAIPSSLPCSHYKVDPGSSQLILYKDDYNNFSMGDDIYLFAQTFTWEKI